jgi:hypothetical protein
LVITLDNEKEKILDLMMGKNRELLDFLIETNADLCIFRDKFYSKGKRKFAAIADFRLYRQSMNLLPFDCFNIYFNVNPNKALQTLFQHPVSDREVKLVNRRLNNDTLTLKSLYHQHLKYPEYMLTMFIL